MGNTLFIAKAAGLFYVTKIKYKINTKLSGIYFGRSIIGD